MQFLHDLRARLKFVEYLESLDSERREAFVAFAQWLEKEIAGKLLVDREYEDLGPIATAQAEVIANLRFMAGWQRLDVSARHNLTTWLSMSESVGRMMPPSSMFAGALFDTLRELEILDEFEKALSSQQQAVAAK